MLDEVAQTLLRGNGPTWAKSVPGSEQAWWLAGGWVSEVCSASMPASNIPHLRDGQGIFGFALAVDLGLNSNQPTPPPDCP